MKHRSGLKIILRLKMTIGPPILFVQIWVKKLAELLVRANIYLHLLEGDVKGERSLSGVCDREVMNRDALMRGAA